LLFYNGNSDLEGVVAKAPFSSPIFEKISGATRILRYLFTAITNKGVMTPPSREKYYSAGDPSFQCYCLRQRQLCRFISSNVQPAFARPPFRRR
jgi:hypothetical protein